MKRLIFPFIFILFAIGLYLFWHIDYRLGVATFLWLWGNNIVEGMKKLGLNRAAKTPGSTGWKYEPDASLQRQPRPQPRPEATNRQEAEHETPSL